VQSPLFPRSKQEVNNENGDSGSKEVATNSMAMDVVAVQEGTIEA